MMMRSSRLLPAAVMLLLTACSAGAAAPADPTDAPAAGTSSTTATTTSTTPALSTTIPSTSLPSTTAATTTLPAAEVTLVSGGVERTYLVHVPPGLAAEPVPLVLDLHGLTSSGEEQSQLSGFATKADTEGFIVVHPQGRGGPAAFWDATPTSPGYEVDLRFLVDVVADVSVRHEIDPDRIHAVGMSNGAGMANRLACDASDVVASVGLVAGAYPLSGLCEPARPVPLVVFHGTRDRVVAYDGFGALLPPIPAFAAGWAERNGCEGAGTESMVAGDVVRLGWEQCAARGDVVLYTIEGGGHGWPGTDYPEKLLDSTDSIDATDLMWDFFEAHPRG